MRTLKQQTFFDQEKSILDQALSAKNRTRLIIQLIWFLGLLFPAPFRSAPLQLKTFFVISGLTAGIISTFRNDNEADDQAESMTRSIKKVQVSLVKDRMRQVYDISELQQNSELTLAKLKAILDLPGVSTQFKIILLQQEGLEDFARALASEPVPQLQAATVAAKPVLEDLAAQYQIEAAKRQQTNTVLPEGAKLIPISALNNINEYCVVIIPHPQGYGKTGTMCAIMNGLDGHKVISTPKPLELPARPIFDLVYGFDKQLGEWSYTGTHDQISLQKTERDLTWYLEQSQQEGNDQFAGSILECVHAAYQESINRQKRHDTAGEPYHVFIDEASVLYLTGGIRTDLEPDVAKKYDARHKNFIETRNKTAFMNYRSQKIQLFLASQTPTLDSLGLQGFGEARDRSWWLHPGNAAIEKALDCKMPRLAQWFRERLEAGYAIALLTRNDRDFHVLDMPPLAEVKAYTDRSQPVQTPIDINPGTNSNNFSTPDQVQSMKAGLPAFVAWANQQSEYIKDDEIANAVQQYFNIKANANLIKHLRSEYIGKVRDV